MTVETRDLGYYIDGGGYEKTVGGPRQEVLLAKGKQVRLDGKEPYFADNHNVIIVKGIPAPQVDIFSHYAHYRFKTSGSWENAWELLRYEDPDEKHVIYVREYDLNYPPSSWGWYIQHEKKPIAELPVTPELNVVFDVKFNLYWNEWTEFIRRRSNVEKETMQRAGLSWDDAPKDYEYGIDDRTVNESYLEPYYNAVADFKARIMEHAEFPVPQISLIRVDEVGPVLEETSEYLRSLKN